MRFVFQWISDAFARAIVMTQCVGIVVRNQKVLLSRYLFFFSWSVCFFFISLSLTHCFFSLQISIAVTEWTNCKSKLIWIAFSINFQERENSVFFLTSTMINTPYALWSNISLKCCVFQVAYAVRRNLHSVTCENMFDLCLFGCLFSASNRFV